MTDALFDMTAQPTAESDPWAMRHGVPVDILDAESDPDTPVDYLRLGVGVTRDRQFRAFRKRVGPLALGWWTALLIVARRDGSFGVVDIDDVELALEATGAPDHADDVASVLDHAAAAGLVWLRARDGVVTIRVRRWREWQVKSPRDRSRLARARQRDRERAHARAREANGARHATASNVTSGRDSHATASNVTLQDKTREEPDLAVGPPPRASAPAREAGDGRSFADRVADLLVDLYPDPADRAAAAGNVTHEAFQRKARFRFGVTVDAIRFGVANLVDHRRRDPSAGARDPIAYIVKRAQSWNPDAPDLSLPTIANGDPHDRPTIPSDPKFARFDGPARPR